MPEAKIEDCRGLPCPQPVINTKKALDSMAKGTVTVLVDNDTARENIMMFAGNAGYTAEVEKIEKGYSIKITKGGAAPMETPNDPVAAEGRASTAYLITSNLLGQGSPDLGQVLMKSLMVTLSEADPPPGSLMFLNSGVLLTCQGSPVLEQLKKLSTGATEIISCGTCLEYYKLKDKLAAGRVGNMLDIHRLLSESAKVITVA